MMLLISKDRHDDEVVMRRPGKHDSGHSRLWPRLWLALCAVPAVSAVISLALSRIWPQEPALIPLLAVPPALAAIGAGGIRRPMACGGVMLVLLAGCTWAGAGLALGATTAAATVAVTVIASIGTTRSRYAETSKRLADVSTVAEAAQRALLRPLPERVGPLELDVLYLAAAAAASVGGDLYEVADTRHGIRLIMGDVQGKGLDAVEVAADVLGMFREVAHEVYTLAEMARRLDAGLGRRAGAGEEFVTAVFVEIDPACGELTIYNCGHPPPILLTGRSGRASTAQDAILLEVPAPAPPLRLMTLGDWSGASTTMPFRPGDTLLLYTDGVTEARDPAGELYPLIDRVAGIGGRHRHGRRRNLLGRLHEDLLRHVGAPLDDDAAMVLIQAPAAWQGRPGAMRALAG
jgi:serine phosphatase RsbU (regulator of sigma subunit)